MFKAPPSQNTKHFYNDLLAGTKKHFLWGSQTRFSPEKIAGSRSSKYIYEPIIKDICNPLYHSLDIGCSTGGFTGILSKYCQHVIGIDLSETAVNLANRYFLKNSISNCKALLSDGANFDYPDQSFDLIQLIDVIHHAEKPETLCEEIDRLLKPGGRIVIFEPNKYNILLWLMCLLDRNEWGALKFGSISSYKKLFSKWFDIDIIDYNGLLIGPDGALTHKLGAWLSSTKRHGLLRTQSPKIFIVLRKNSEHQTSSH